MSVIISRNPANGEKLAEIPVLNAADVAKAVAKARTAQSAWSKLSINERAAKMLDLRQTILNNIDSIASLISRENGKPLIEAISHDIMPSMDLITYFSKSAKKILKKETICLGKWNLLGHSSHIEYYPYGVVGIISPWNFPFSIPMGEVVMALLAGNTVVLKPSEFTTLVGLKIDELFRQTGFPEDVLVCITGDGSTGAALVDSDVDKIIFTGSVPTGKKIMAAAAKTLKPITLELGGKDPFIVLPDADLDMASSAAVWGAFCNSGQVCASVERVYVPEHLAEAFTKLVVSKTKKLKQGVGDSPDVAIGAMTAEMQVKKVEDQVSEAVKRGARVLTGGERDLSLGSQFFKPTVITGIDDTFEVIKDETFGPVLPILTYKTIDEAVKRANDSPYALNAYLWAGDIEQAQEVASQLVAGTVNINESVFSYAVAQTPWGGPKESGVGRTHGIEGLLDLVQKRHVHINKRSSKFNNFWWYGYSSDKLQMIKDLCQALFGKGFKRISGLLSFINKSGKVETY